MANPQDPKHRPNQEEVEKGQVSDFGKDGKIRVELIYDMKTGTLSMGSGAPEIMVLGVLTQAITMVGQKQVLKTLSTLKPLNPKKSILLKQ